MKGSEALLAEANGPSDAASNDGIVTERAILLLASELAALRELLEERLPYPVRSATTIKTFDYTVEADDTMPSTDAALRRTRESAEGGGAGK